MLAECDGGEGQVAGEGRCTDRGAAECEFVLMNAFADGRCLGVLLVSKDRDRDLMPLVVHLVW